MKLHRLTLENFQGIKALSLDFGNGRSASIYGDNATGKTTIYNAVTWLLFDKASTAARNFTPKTRTEDGEAHHLNHSAEAVFEADSGRIITFKKTLHEVYKRKRGTASEEFSGHTVEYEIDGVPAKEKDFANTVLAYCGGDLEKPKMLTMPDYFPEQLPWETRRKILLEVCGDISDDDVIASVPELAELKDFLRMNGTADQYYSIDEYRKVANSRRAAINKQLGEIPARIDEAAQAIPDISGLDAEAIQRRIEDLEERRRTFMEDRAAAASGDAATASVREEIAKLRARIAEGRAEHIRKQQEANSSVEADIAILRRQAAQKRDEIDEMRRGMAAKKEEAYRLESLRTQLVDDYKRVQKEYFSDDQTVCPTCGQRLPNEKIASLREEFNARRSRRLEDINARGKREASKDAIAALKAEADDLMTRAINAEDELRELQDSIETLQARLAPAVAWETTDDYTALNATISALNQKLLDSGEAVREAQRAIDEKIRETADAIRDEQDKLMQITMSENQERRISELEKQEKRLSAEYDEIEKGLHLCDVFTKAKVDALTDSINGKFRSVRFRLFQDQINGGLKEDCEVMVPTDDGRLVPFAFANNAARINAGLEIIDTLSRHWDVSMPIFVDNAESVTRLIRTDAQVIRLVVSEADKKLRLEVDA